MFHQYTSRTWDQYAPNAIPGKDLILENCVHSFMRGGFQEWARHLFEDGFRYFSLAYGPDGSTYKSQGYLLVTKISDAFRSLANIANLFENRNTPCRR